MRTTLLLMAVAGAAQAQDASIQRALLELDQRTIEFAARVQGAAGADLRQFENLAARQLLDATASAPAARRPDARVAANRETETFLLRLPPPVVRVSRPEPPKPLPAGPPCIVDVVPGGEPPRCR